LCSLRRIALHRRCDGREPSQVLLHALLVTLKSVRVTFYKQTYVLQLQLQLQRRCAHSPFPLPLAHLSRTLTQAHRPPRAPQGTCVRPSTSATRCSAAG
jgi:hypothetical protein